MNSTALRIFTILAVTVLFLLVIVLGTVAGISYVSRLKLSAKAQELESLLSETRKQADDLKTQIDTELTAALEKIKALEQENARLGGQLREPQQATPTTGAGGAAGQQQDMQKLLSQLLSSGKKAAANDGKSPLSGIADMFSGEQGKQYADMSARMAVNMQYTDLFEQLNLSPELEARVRDIFAKNMSDQITQSMEMLKEGKPDTEKMRQLEQASKDNLRRELNNVLSRREFAAWEEYETTKDARTLEQAYNMQLSMYAGGLTTENRDKVKKALAEETLAMQGQMKSATGAPSDYVQYQVDALYQTRERVAPEMDAQQLAQLDKFITRMEEQYEMQRKMIEGMQGGTVAR